MVTFRRWAGGPDNDFLVSVDMLGVPRVGETVFIGLKDGTDCHGEVAKVEWIIDAREDGDQPDFTVWLR